MSLERAQQEQVENIMRAMNPGKVSVRDSKSFSQCIAREKRSEVLARCDESQAPAGYAVAIKREGEKHASYNEEQLKLAARAVKSTKSGECHKLAQWAAWQLLDGMQPYNNIKLVTHEAGRGSHTFVLLGYDDGKPNHEDHKISFEDLKKRKNSFLIIDPWASGREMGLSPRP